MSKNLFNRLVIQLLCFLSCIVLVSNCSPDNGTDYYQDLLDSGVSRALLPGDPNLDPEWDWSSYDPETNPQMYTMWSRSGNTGGTPGGDIVQHDNVQLPQFSHSPGPAGIYLQSTGDYLPEDGWVLLLKNFGNSPQATPANDPPKQPFFILYNIPRGIMRVIFYYTGEDAYQYMKVVLKSYPGSYQCASEKTSLFTFNRNEYNCFEDYGNEDTQKNIWNGIIAYSKVMSAKWSMVDFVVSFDPLTLKKQDIGLDISFHLIKEENLSLAGKAHLNQIVETETINKSPWDIALSALTGIVSIGKNIAAIKGEIDTEKEKTNIANPGSMNPTQVSGENMEGIVAALAIASAAVSIGKTVYNFISGLKPSHHSYIAAQWYDINMTGVITSETPFDHILMSLPGGIRTSSAIAPLQPLQNNPLGIFILNEKPKIGWKTVGFDERTNEEIFDNGARKIVTNGKYWKRTFGLLEPVRVELNELSGYHVKSTEASFVWEGYGLNSKANGGNGTNNFMEINDFYLQRNCYDNDGDNMININDLLLDEQEFYEEELIEYCRNNQGTFYVNRKWKKKYTENSSEVSKAVNPGVQIVIDIEKDEIGTSYDTVLLKTYQPEFSNEIPDNPSEVMVLKQDTTSIISGRDYNMFSIKALPPEIGITRPKKLSFKIYNKSTSQTLELTGSPLVKITNLQSENCFSVTTQPEDEIALQGDAAFEIKFDCDTPGNYSARVEIYSNDSSTNPYDFIISGVVTEAINFVATSPSNFKALINNSNIDLSWEDNSRIESGYKIYRRINGEENFVQIAQLSSNSIDYTDILLPYLGEEKRWYLVTAYNNTGETIPIMAHVHADSGCFFDISNFGEAYWEN